jgi:hypothetical protein
MVVSCGIVMNMVKSDMAPNIRRTSLSEIE